MSPLLETEQGTNKNLSKEDDTLVSVWSAASASGDITIDDVERSTELLNSGQLLNFVLPRSLSESLPRLYETKLIPLDLTFGMVREETLRISVDEVSRMVLQDAVAKAPRAQVSVCLVVKRPGCVLCHEQGQDLTKLLSEFRDIQVAGWAVVKEINVDNAGLLSLYKGFFKFPFFRDPSLALYSALGDRRVGLSPNPIRMVKRYREVRKRLKEKKIEGSIIGKGEGLLLGGVIVFDRHGKIRYAHQEQFMRELPVGHLRKALRRIVNESKIIC